MEIIVPKTVSSSIHFRAYDFLLYLKRTTNSCPIAYAYHSQSFPSIVFSNRIIYKSKHIISAVLELWVSYLSYLYSGVFWDVTPCGSCKNQRFGGT
jgi:hypothetical protein